MLDQALMVHGMRARFWGPMSGLSATIGGSISQGSVTFGSGQVGASANAVRSMEIITGNAELLHTGSDAVANTSAFNRNFGPDLTGLFGIDCVTRQQPQRVCQDRKIVNRACDRAGNIKAGRKRKDTARQ